MKKHIPGVQKNRLRLLAVMFISWLVFGLMAVAPALAVNYTITDLGTLGGTSSHAYGINDSGQVVGYSSASGDTAVHAFLYSDGIMRDLGTLGGSWSIAYGINNKGMIVGSLFPSPHYSSPHAFLYSGGEIADLGTLGGTVSEAYGINKLGQVVGSSAISNRSYHAFLYSDGVMMDLGTLGGSMELCAGY